MSAPVAKHGLAATLLAVLAGLALAYLGFWAWRTATIEQPYDEVWIGLNAPLPRPLRAWSCGQVKARQARPSIPPYGCQDGVW